MTESHDDIEVDPQNQECKTNSDCAKGQRCRNTYCLSIRREKNPTLPPPDIDPEEDNTVLRRKIQNVFSLNNN